MKTFKSVAVAATREAGDRTYRQFHRLTKADIRRKGAHDLVTRADMQANALIIKQIKRHFPEHDILSEETGYEDNPSDYVWSIDPIDGTTNYTIGSPLFCTAVALLKGREVVLSVVYAPAMNELYYAERGKGAYLNGKKIRVSRTKALRDAIVLLERSHGPASRKRFLSLQQRLQNKVLNMRRFSSLSLDLAFVAAGRVEGMLLAPPSSSLWDVAPGALLVQEAGGIVHSFDNNPWNSSDHGLVATNKGINTAVKRAIRS